MVLVKGLFQMLGIIVGTALCCALFTRYEPDAYVSATKIGGLPVVAIAQVGAVGWLALGQAAAGVLVLAQGGAGVVLIGQGGVGLLFGIGQVSFGLLSIAQLGIGVMGFMGQLGVGVNATGQGVFRKRPKPWLTAASEELTELLRSPYKRTPASPWTTPEGRPSLPGRLPNE